MSIVNRDQITLGPYQRIDTIGGVEKPFPVEYHPAYRVYDRTDRNSCGWIRQLLAVGARLPDLPYTKEVEKATYPSGSWSTTWIPNGDRNDYSGVDPAGFGTTTYLKYADSDFMSASLIAQNRVLSKLKNQKVNLGNAIAERQQVVGMVASTATKLANAVLYLKTGNYRKAVRALGKAVPVKTVLKNKFSRNFARGDKLAVPNAWLELQYGWLPLLSDLDGAMEQLAQWTTGAKKPPVLTAATIVKLCPREDISGIPPGYSARRSLTGQLSYGVTYTVDNSVFRNWSAVGLTNPLSIAWELAPWSFVVDWFLPIGNWLNNLDATVGLSFVGGWWTSSYKSQINLLASYDYVSANVRWKKHANGRADWFYMHRSPQSGFPSVLSGLAFRNPFSKKRAANALALLMQAFSTPGKRPHS